MNDLTEMILKEFLEERKMNKNITILLDEMPNRGMSYFHLLLAKRLDEIDWKAKK